MPSTNQVFEKIDKDLIKESIGTQKEKTIHHFLKYCISDDPVFHEIKLGNHIVDVFINNHVYEIQTQGFDKLRKKLEYLLNLYPVTIVYPIMIDKTIYKVDSDGVISNGRKSPKRISPLSIGFELYKIKDYLLNTNLTFKLVLLKGDEYQTTRLDRYKRIRSTRIDQYPNEIVDIIDINNYHEFNKLIPDLGLFTAKDFGKASKLSGRKLSSALLAFRHLGVIEITGKDGKAYVYKKSDC